MDRQEKIAMVADMIESAKNILKSAEAIANEEGMYFSLEDIYEDLSGNSDVDWNSSNCY